MIKGTYYAKMSQLSRSEFSHHVLVQTQPQPQPDQLEYLQQFKIDPKLCLVKDKDGITPLLGATKAGCVHLVEELLRILPESAMEVTEASETVLHVAMRNGREEVVKLLLRWIEERPHFGELVNRKDCAGNTLLHLAVSRKHLQIIKLLLADNRTYKKKVEINAMTDGGFTALDILDVLPQSGRVDMEIEKILRRAGASRGKDLAKRTSNHRNQKHIESHHELVASNSPSSYPQLHILLVIATFFAVITFYATLKWPGERLEGTDEYKSHRQSSYLMHLFLFFNSAAFVTSVAMILILIHEFPMKLGILISVFSMLGAYTCIVIAQSSQDTLPVFLLGSPIMLLAAVSTLKLLQKSCTWSRCWVIFFLLMHVYSSL